ncbi:hypothetical protein B0H17DRAFT_1205892 [Mycena rosella]|uniref:F-box domain-containing protein n=1 Tax=Mycena rosella TaxID=1033263 RepID=A0AAD7D6J3_MYCRO|nr:hypothetical protein B0H17DRAFT_1205892 [Mycena rosella]
MTSIWEDEDAREVADPANQVKVGRPTWNHTPNTVLWMGMPPSFRNGVPHGLEKKMLEVEEDLALVVYPVLTLPNEVISQICNHWREIAISTPQLWTSIDLSRHHRQVGYDSYELLKTWFSRAKRLPLSLRSFRVHRGILALLPSFADRLQQLDLNISSFESSGLKSVPHFPHLRRLGTTLVSTELVILLKNCPSIRELDVPAWTRFISTVVPSSLTGLKITAPVSVEEFFHILTMYPLLSDLSCVLSNRITGTLPSTTTPGLQSLTLMGLYAHEQLNFLTAPNLRRLQVVDA